MYMFTFSLSEALFSSEQISSNIQLLTHFALEIFGASNVFLF